MIVLIGPNSRATKNQMIVSKQLGRICSKNKILCIHGGGDGTMLAVTEGILESNVTLEEEQCLVDVSSFCKVVSPTDMMSDNEIYNRVLDKTLVKDIHERIGMLLEFSNQCKYIVCYAGGIGTIHEFLSFLVYWYKEPEKMPEILLCDVDFQGWTVILINLLKSLVIPERPYMSILMNKINVVSSKELYKKIECI